MKESLRYIDTRQIWHFENFTDDIWLSIQNLCQEFPAAKIIFIVDNLKDDQVLRAWRLGASDVFSIDQVSVLLEDTLDRLYQTLLQQWILEQKECYQFFRSGFAVGTARLLHDLNSPFTTIQNYIDLMELELESSEDEAKQLDEVLESGIAQSREILDHWREYLITIEPEPDNVNIAMVMKSSLALQKASGRHILLRTSPPEVHPDCPDDPVIETFIGIKPYLELAFYQILKNACEAVADQSNPEIHISLNEHNGMFTIIVEDNGPGIPQHLGQTYWKDFVSSKSQPGAGLGLGIARYLITMHGGSVQMCEGTLGGACFQIRFRPLPGKH